MTGQDGRAIAELGRRLEEADESIQALLSERGPSSLPETGEALSRRLSDVGETIRKARRELELGRLERTREAERRAAAGWDQLLRHLRRRLDRMPRRCILIEPDEYATGCAPPDPARGAATASEAGEAFVPKEVRPWLAAFLRELLAGAGPDDGPTGSATPADRPVVCDRSDPDRRDGPGSVVGLLELLRDVSNRVAADEALRASEARLGRFLEGLPVATVVARPDGSIESVNRRASELYGPDAAGSATLAALLKGIVPDREERRTAARALERMRETATGGGAETPLLLRVRRGAGQERVVAVDCVVIDDREVWTATELTDLVRLEAERARLGRIVEESLDEVYVIDAATLRFRSANRSARDNTGFTTEELRERTPAEIEPELDPGSFERLFAPLREGRVRGLRYETVHRRRDGSSYPVEVHLQMSTEEDDPVFVAIVQDISVRRRAEEEIRTLNAELEGRVRKRTAELEEANRELEAFAYSVSHDLRAPLRAMDGFSQILIEDYGRVVDDEGRRHLARVRAGAQRMGRLVDDLLRLSRIARAELRLEDVSLSALAAEIGDELLSGEPEGRVALTVEAGLTVRADRNLLRILLENLLRNAFKFTSRKERARIVVGREVGSGGDVFFVRDDGAGFDMAYAGELFKAFSRLHTPGEFEGMGIGLAIVERIVRRHGGRISAEGAPGRGATFRFELGGAASPA